jgi:thiosulfate/3-mercaptopyruvate sulfurtransferase
MRAAGVSDNQPVVIYDGIGAARAWWLLRYFGHQRVAVLDGGLAAWDGPLARGVDSPEPGDFTARPGAMPVLDARRAAALAAKGVLLDARAPERFRGEVEPVDPVAGHIPGARNWPATNNLASDGRFRSPHELRAEFERLGVREDVPAGAYCGSGVAAAHEVLALELAGFEAALYAGSWSEWITDPQRPVERFPRAAP